MSNYFCLQGDAREIKIRDIKWEFAMRRNRTKHFSRGKLLCKGMDRWRRHEILASSQLGQYSLRENSSLIVWCFFHGVCECAWVYNANCSLKIEKQIDYMLGVKWFLNTMASGRKILEYPELLLIRLGFLATAASWYLILKILKWK